MLSKGEQTLIKSMLSDIPVYYMSLLTMLTSVAKKLEAIQCRFLYVLGREEIPFGGMRCDQETIE